MNSGLFLHVISVSFLLCIVTPSFVKIDIVSLSAVFPTLIRDVGNLLNVSACLAFDDNDGTGKLVTCFPLLFSMLATDDPTRIHTLRKHVGQAEDKTRVETVRAKQ